ncbi:B-4DMT family transporter [Mycolicibacterium confluentis]|uniref:Membrane protein n=1 Tax=Mycolicibacterium confluentis TaxID=28047 RepID=A0A7I7XXE3_9MYCO|nr:B-4DMT family transporter [Mycolicibacterium confluentis]MCV7318462.1 B-4DMT family transporter [Mycolicibacterium confluentis]ORV20288.1 hypothetical protein AWB99_07525 [Mycolicibacterium confluentis]BBZ33998.1 membrane protein [Mycolicibacterium confluentis]
MSKWLLRGLVFAALMVVVRLVQGTLINQFETQALLISVVALAVFGLIALLWGFADGRFDARANPDPDRRNDLAMTWLVAGLVAGLLSGAVCWLLSLLYPALYVGGLINELTTFAAFTALLVFLPSITAVAVGRWLVDRKAPPVQRKTHSLEESRTDTDVFAAVRDDEGAAAQTEQQTSSVAVAERDTETVSPDKDRPRD